MCSFNIQVRRKSKRKIRHIKMFYLKSYRWKKIRVSPWLKRKFWMSRHPFPLSSPQKIYLRQSEHPKTLRGHNHKRWGGLRLTNLKINKIRGVSKSRINLYLIQNHWVLMISSSKTSKRKWNQWETLKKG